MTLFFLYIDINTWKALFDVYVSKKLYLIFNNLTESNLGLNVPGKQYMK